MSGELVLVTGGSGFVGAHCILQLLGAGYRVRATVRNLGRESDVRAMLKVGGADPGTNLTFAATDLLSDAGLPRSRAATSSCTSRRRSRCEFRNTKTNSSRPPAKARCACCAPPATQK
jgi:NAD(P)-dependent dehydrogenase (short-subunit alcohol dehydrogenase family)